MPTDLNSNPQTNPLEREDVMFAPRPIWERNTKTRRGRAAARASTAAPAAAAPTVAPETRSFAARPDTADLRRARTVTTPVIDEPASEALMRRPIAPVRRTSSAAVPMAIAAGVVVIGGLAAAGWYASHPRDTGVAQLTPGVPASTTTTTAAMTPPAAPTQMAANTLPSVPAPVASTQTTRTTVAETPRHTTTVKTTVRRPARSVDDAAMDTSATLPAAPMPYTGTAVNPPLAATPPAAPAQMTPSVPAGPAAATTAPPEPAAVNPAPAESTTTTTTTTP